MSDFDPDDLAETAEKMFDWIEFDDFVKDVCNEANYWAGYGRIFKRDISDEFDLEDGLDLTRKAGSLKTGLYKLAKERTLHIAKRASDEQTSGYMYSPTQEKEYNAELDRMEDAILYKGFQVFRQRKKFIEFLEYMELPLRTRFNQRKKFDEDED